MLHDFALIRELVNLAVVGHENGRGYPSPRGKHRSNEQARRAETRSRMGEAASYLGLMYADGRGAPKDDAQAVRWYRKAADVGDASGMSNLERQSRTRSGSLSIAISVVWEAEERFRPGRGCHRAPCSASSWDAAASLMVSRLTTPPQSRQADPSSRN